MKRLLLIVAGFTVLTAVISTTAYLTLGQSRLEEIPVSRGAPSTAPGTYEVNLDHNGLERRYLLHVPPGLTTGPMPLVLALHGLAGTPEVMESLTGFATLADEQGFLLVFPAGIDKMWLDGFPEQDAEAAEVDDAGFLHAVVDDVARQLAVDERRVYLTGVSNGAFMTARIACEDTGRFAAVGLVVGTARPGYLEQCRPARPLPLIVFLSTEDAVVPFGGEPVEVMGPLVKSIAVVSADEMIGFWARNNVCSEEPVVETLPDRTPSDDSTVTRETYSTCRENAEIEFYRVEGAGHTWPGGGQYVSPFLIGTTNRDINATRLIWEFFEKHPRP